MEFFNTMQIGVPVTQLAFLLIISTLALLFGRKRLALLICYVFTLYWGSMVNMESMLLVINGKVFYGNSMLYFGFGFMVVLLASIGFITHPD